VLWQIISVLISIPAHGKFLLLISVFENLQFLIYLVYAAVKSEKANFMKLICNQYMSELLKVIQFIPEEASRCLKRDSPTLAHRNNSLPPIARRSKSLPTLMGGCDVSPPPALSVTS